MKKQILCAAISCVLLLAGCGNEKPLDSSGFESVESSVESSSVESSSSSSVESSVDTGDGSIDDIAVIVTDNQDILKSSSTSGTTDSSSNSDTSTDVSTSEPTSEPTSTSSSSNSGTASSSTSTPTTSQPTSSSSSSTTSKPSSQPVTSTWNPDAPGNTPGPYGGYYDASGTLHAINKNVPRDSYGAPVVSFWTEDGRYIMTKAEKEAARAEEERIWNGGHADDGDLTDEQIKDLWGGLI